MTLPPRSALFLTLSLGLALISAQGIAAPAETPMTAAEFEAYATGKTLSYAMGPTIWGAEQYLENRQVIWAFDKTDCQYGIWFEDAGNICFVYENDPAPQCWRFFKDSAGLRAELVDDPAGTRLSEVSQSADPLQCKGPDVGV